MPLIPPYAAGPGNPEAVFRILTAAGWTRSVSGHGNTAVTSPDRLMTVEHGPHDPRYLDDGGPLWRIHYLAADILELADWSATFGANAPVEMIAAFAIAMTAAPAEDRRGTDRPLILRPSAQTPEWRAHVAAARADERRSAGARSASFSARLAAIRAANWERGADNPRPSEVLTRPLTPADVRNWPDYFIGGHGTDAAHSTRCPHAYRLTDSCPGCDADQENDDARPSAR